MSVVLVNAAAAGSQIVTRNGNSYTVDAAGYVSVNAVDVLDLMAAGYAASSQTGAALRNNLTATTDPAASNDSTQDYAKGSRWVNTSGKREWICVDATAATAVWVLVGRFPDDQYSTAALQATVVPAANIAGARQVAFENTGTTPANLQLDTAANIVAAIPGAYVGQAYRLKIRNSSGSANTATITTNTGLTLHGTMTIAQNVTREFVVVLTSLSAIDIYSLGASAAAA